jgi:hypothetical protein
VTGSQKIAGVFRYLWAGPNSGVGLFFALLASLTGGSWEVVDGVLEAEGGVLGAMMRRLPTSGSWRKPAGAAALTLGHVVLAVDQAALDRTRLHERVHVRQYGRWGPLFLPAYLLATLAAKLRGEHGYLANRFEREAYAVSHPERFADSAG